VRGQSEKPEPAVSGLSEAQVYERLPASTSEITWSSDGAFLAATGSFHSKSGTRFGDVALWSVGTVRGSVFDRSTGPGRVLSLAWHPAQPVLALGDAVGRAHIWDVGSAKRRRLAFLPEQVSGDSDGITALTWAADGSILVTAERLGRGGAFGIFDVQARRLISKEYLVSCNSLCWCPALWAFLGAGSDGCVYIHAIDGTRITRTARA
jgi:WD40 repeat protein